MPTIVVTFIVRRLIATFFLLIVVSMITYAVFFLIPRIAGQNSYQLATQYVGRNPTRSAVLAIEDKLGVRLFERLIYQMRGPERARRCGDPYLSGDSAVSELQ